MNERIKELEALCWEDIPCAPYWDGMPGKHELYTTKKVFNKEKFAELILEECYLWAKENGGLGCEEDFEALKEHFGIQP